jgi:hypothetical protein
MHDKHGNLERKLNLDGLGSIRRQVTRVDNKRSNG